MAKSPLLMDKTESCLRPPAPWQAGGARRQGCRKEIHAAAAVFLLTVALPSVGSAAGGKSWQAEWETTMKAAHKEGQVTIYAFSGGPLLPIQSGVFQKRFPEIKVVTVAGDPVPRILAERRAGKYLADIAIGGSSTPRDLYLAKALDSIKDAMILPEVLDESKWWQGRHRFIDPERKYAFTFIGHPDTGSIYYNTNVVDSKEFHSFWNFLDPKWKGKMEARDIRAAGGGASAMRVFYYNPRLGSEFIRRVFSEMDITLFRDRRQGIDWLATGRFPICFFCSGTDIGIAKRQGLPVAEFGAMKEGIGLSSSGGNLGLLNRGPHPNAVKVFINWFLSREGQLTVQREYSRAGVGYSNSLRTDIPKDMVPPESRLREGINYIEVDSPEKMSMEPIFKVFNEALAKAGK